MNGSAARIAPHGHAQEGGGGYWEKFDGGKPAFKGNRVLEIGCGLGGRSIEMARAGAIVTGIDIMEDRIQDADTIRRELDAETAGRLTFRACQIEDLDADAFDIVTSENTFEHIVDVPAALAAIRKILVVGGRAYIGFNPLFHSPWGDHGWLRKGLPFGFLPWSHLFLPRQMTYKMAGAKIGHTFVNTVDWPYLALNQHTAHEYRGMFKASGLKVISIAPVKHHAIHGKLFDLLARFDPLEKFFTDGIYCVLER